MVEVVGEEAVVDAESDASFDFTEDSCLDAVSFVCESVEAGLVCSVESCKTLDDVVDLVQLKISLYSKGALDWPWSNREFEFAETVLTKLLITITAIALITVRAFIF